MQLTGGDQKAKILIVEDEYIIGVDLAHRVEKLGFTVCALVSTGDDATRTAKRERPDLVLMDIILEGKMDGIEAAEKIRVDQGAPIIFITAHVDEEYLGRAKLILPFGYLLKPFQDRELKIAIDMALHVSRVEAERKRAEEALKQSEAILANTFEAISDLLIVIDRDFLIHKCNWKDHRFVGENIKVGRSRCYEVIRHRDRPCEVCGAMEVFGTGKPYEYEDTNPLDGRTREIRIYPIKDARGEVQMVVEHLRDITEQKKMNDALLESRAALSESEEKFRKMYELAPVGIARVSLDFHIIEANRAYCSMLGYTEEELIGKHLADITHPETIEENLRKQAQLGMGEIPSFMLEKKFIHKKGHVVSGILNAAAVHNGAGKPLFYLGIVQDITDRKKAEQAIRVSKETLTTILDSIEADIFVSDMETYEKLFINSHMRNSYGGSAGQPCHLVFRGLEQPCDHCTNDRLLDAEGNSVGLVVWEDLNPITGRWYMNNDQAIHWVDGRMVHLQVAMDITDQKQSETEREKLEQRLLQARKMEAIGTLAGGIAHDFNNVLSAIVGYTQLCLMEMDGGGPIQYNLKQSLNAAGRAKELIRQILTFSRQSEAKLEPVEISPIVKESVKFLRSSIPTTIEIRHEIPEFTGTILADPTNIHQVMMNLGTNAVQAMKEKGGVLTVKLHEIEIQGNMTALDLPPGRYLQLVVSDTGQGIDPAIRDRIFEPYFTTKKQSEGTGMGLAMVHGIISDCNGVIKFDSEVSKGTTFKIWFPVITDSRELDAPESTMVPTGKERILLVDDEQGIVDVGRQMLARLGYTVVIRSDGRAALDLFRESPKDYDLIITDQTMPGITGAELARECMKVRPSIPVIICTGFSHSINAESAMEMGIKEFLMKPLVLGNLAEAVRRVLDEAKGHSGI